METQNPYDGMVISTSYRSYLTFKSASLNKMFMLKKKWEGINQLRPDNL